MSSRSFSYVALGALALLVGPLAALAQFDASNDPFTLALSPQFPEPGSQATLTPISGQVDITSATMVVTVNGKQLYSGNAIALALPLGAAGSTANVVVRLTAAGQTYTQTLAVTPEDVALVPEPLSSAPPLYAGKPLVPNEGSVRLVALADLRTTSGKRLDPTTLSYRWTVDSVASSGSGIGKSTLIVDSPLPYRSSSVSVQVVSPDGSLAGGSSLNLAASDPTVRIYARDALLGIRFDHALTAFNIGASEATLYAAPYSFPLALGAPIVSWFLNGTSAQTGALITLRPTGSAGGSASLSASVSAGDVSSAASAALTFGASSSSSSFFGL